MADHKRSLFIFILLLNLLFLRHLLAFFFLWPFLFVNVEFCKICYSCYFCAIYYSISSHSKKKSSVVNFAIFAKFADFSKPFLTFSLSKCRILLNLLFLLFLPYLVLNLFTRKKSCCYFRDFCEIWYFTQGKVLLLLRFLRNLYTDFTKPFLTFSVSKCRILLNLLFLLFLPYLVLNLFTRKKSCCYFRDFCEIWYFTQGKVLLLLRFLRNLYTDFTKPFLTFSVSKCRILLNLLFLLFLPYLLLNLFTQQEKLLLLSRFLRNLIFLLYFSDSSFL